MRSIFYLFLFWGSFLLLSGCQPAQETPEQFVDRLIPILKEGNEDQLFETLISKDELRTLIELVAPPDLPANQLDARVDELWKAALEDKGNMMRRFQRAGVSDWDQAVIDSVTKQRAPQTTFDGKPIHTDQLELADITVHFTYNGAKKTMKINCIQIGKGPWKMANYPEMEDAR